MRAITAGSEANPKMPSPLPAAEGGLFQDNLQVALGANNAGSTPAGSDSAGGTGLSSRKAEISPKAATLRKPAAATDATSTMSLLFRAPVAQSAPWELPLSPYTDVRSLTVTEVMSKNQANVTEANANTRVADPQSDSWGMLSQPAFPEEGEEESSLVSAAAAAASSANNVTLMRSGDPELPLSAPAATDPLESTYAGSGVPSDLPRSQSPKDASGSVLKGTSGVAQSVQAANGLLRPLHSVSETSPDAKSRPETTSTTLQATSSVSQSVHLGSPHVAETLRQNAPPPVIVLEKQLTAMPSSSSIQQADGTAEAMQMQSSPDDVAPIAFSKNGKLDGNATESAFAASAASKEREGGIRSGLQASAFNTAPAVSLAHAVDNHVQSLSPPQTKIGSQQGASFDSTEAGEPQISGIPSTNLNKVLQHSEMQVHIDAAEFGQVSVHARYDQSGIAAHIRLDDSSMASALGSALSANATHLEHRLQGSFGTSASVSVSTDTSSAHSGGGEAQSESRAKTRVPAAVTLRSDSSLYSADVTTGSLVAVASGAAADRRVDIRI